MCLHCARWLDGLCLPHEADQCPLRQAFYCSLCAIYGHETGKCGGTVIVDPARLEGTKKAKEKKQQILFQQAKRAGRRLVFLPSE